MLLYRIVCLKRGFHLGVLFFVFCNQNPFAFIHSVNDAFVFPKAL